MEVFGPYLDQLKRAERKLAAIEERARKWAGLASVDNWAETTGDAEETALADAGRAILAITGAGQAPAAEAAGVQDPAAGLSIIREQARRYLRAVYGSDLVYKAPETFPGPERWIWAVAYAQGPLAETVVGGIEQACAARREKDGRA